MEKGNIISLVVLVILIITMVPVIIQFRSSSENMYRCDSDSLFTRLNQTLCMNTTGGNYISAEYIGISPIEKTLIGLVILVIILSVVILSMNTIKK